MKKLTIPRIPPLLATILAGFLLPATSQAAVVLYKLSTTKAASGATDYYDASKVIVTTSANVTGTAAADIYPSTDANGLETFRNVETWAGSTGGGFDLADSGHITLSDVTSDFSNGYVTFTVSAASGYALNLTSLAFNSGRGNTTSTRGYVMYATVNGAAFSSSATPIKHVADENAAATRSSPLATSIDLSGAAYQGVSSVTFRYYTLTSTGGTTIGFDAMNLNGTVDLVPEPSSLGLLALGGIALAARRKRS